MNNRHLHRHAFQAFHVINVCCVITRRKYIPAVALRKWTAAIAAFCRFSPLKTGYMMNKNTPRRMVITTKDITNILGKGERSARELMQKLRVVLKKEPEQYVTVAEFCRFVGLTEEEVRDFFNYGMLYGLLRP